MTKTKSVSNNASGAPPDRQQAAEQQIQALTRSNTAVSEAAAAGASLHSTDKHQAERLQLRKTGSFSINAARPAFFCSLPQLIVQDTQDSAPPASPPAAPSIAVPCIISQVTAASNSPLLGEQRLSSVIPASSTLHAAASAAAPEPDASDSIFPANAGATLKTDLAAPGAQAQAQTGVPRQLCSTSASAGAALSACLTASDVRLAGGQTTELLHPSTGPTAASDAASEAAVR